MMSVTGAALREAARIALYRKDFPRFAAEQLKILTKESKLLPFVLHPYQLKLYGKMEAQRKRFGFIRQVWLKNRQIGTCLDLDTRVLTQDLRWVPIGSVEPGDGLVSVDEYPPCEPVACRGRDRKLRPAVVVATVIVHEPAFRLVFDNGVEIIATGPHRFLSATGVTIRRNLSWRRVETLHAGSVVRFAMPPWSAGDTYEDGWFAGILDGEGSVSRNRPGVGLRIAQLPGPVFERIQAYLKSRGYTYRVDFDDRPAVEGGKHGSRPVAFAELSRMTEIFRVLGQTQPSRWRSRDWWSGKAIPGKGRAHSGAWATVVAIEPLGLRPMIDLQTTTQTFLAEGLVSHNSTLSQGKIFQRTVLWPYTNSLVVAHNDPIAQKIFLMARRFYDNLDMRLRPMVRYDTKSELVFENPGADRQANPGLLSRIEVATAKNIHSGAGGTYHCVQLTEAARYPNPKEIEASVLQTVPLVEGSMVLIESTAFTTGDWFRAQCDAARAGLSHYEFTFIGYNEDPTATVPLEAGEVLQYDEEEAYLATTYGLRPDQIKWRRFKLAEALGDLDQFNQENPLDYDDAWVTKEFAVFPINQLRRLQPALASPKFRGDVLPGGRIQRAMDGPLAVWEEPQDGALYDIGADVSMGIGADASCAVVLKRPTNEQVAEWHGQAEPGEWAEILANLGYYYQTALVNCEANTIGKWTNAELLKRYPNIYLERRLDRIDQRPTRWLGFLTTHQSKRMLVGRAKDKLYRWTISESDRYPLIRSQRLWDELRTFVKKSGTETYGGAPNQPDDCVMAWMLALMAGYDEASTYMGPTEAMGVPTSELDLATIMMNNDPAIQVGELERPQARGLARPTSWYGDLDGWPRP